MIKAVISVHQILINITSQNYVYLWNKITTSDTTAQ